MLLEVIVSLVIVSVTLASVMRSFTVSVRGTRNSEVVTIGTMLAKELLHTFEIRRPEEDELQGDFEEDGYPFYYWEASFEEVKVNYPKVTLEGEIEDFTNIEKVTIDIYYDNNMTKSYRAVHVESYLTGIEKFTHASKRENVLY